MARRWNHRDRLITSIGSGPVKMTMMLTIRDPILIDGDQYEIILVEHGITRLHETVIGRRAALERFEELKPRAAVMIAKAAMQL